MADKKPKKTKIGPSSFVLMIGDEGAILVQMQKKRVVRRIFAQSPDPMHIRSMEEALGTAPRAPLMMIVDMMDQSYVRQTLPPVSSFSVGKIVRRRLDKDFSRDDVKGYLVLDREKTGRRDWNYLMVSLANPPLLQKWINFAVERANPFKGIGLVPLESQTFIEAIARTFLKDKGKEAKPLEWQILVSHHKVGGFRQVVLKNGKLVFTRMAQPIGESNPEVIAGNIEQEMINTQEYLKRMGLTDPATLSVIILVSSDIKQVLDPKNIKAGECHLLTPHEMATALTLPDAAQPEDHFGDVVVSAFVGRRRKLLLPLGTPYTVRLRKFASYIQFLRLGAAAAALGIVGWMGMSAWDIWSAKSDTQAIIDQQRGIRAQLTTIKNEAKSLPKQINLYTDVMNMARGIDRRRTDPLVFVNDFSATLQGAALVKTFHWNLADSLAIGKDLDKRIMQADIDLQLLTPPQPHEQFIASAQMLLDRIKKAFPDYEMTHSELPGLLSDTRELKTVISDNGSAVPVSEGTNNTDIVKVTLRGTPEQAGKNGH